MASTTPSPTEEPSLRASLLRNLGGAVGLVVLVAAVFGVIGMIGRADTATPIGAQGADQDEVAAPTEDPVETPAPEPTEPAEVETTEAPEPEETEAEEPETPEDAEDAEDAEEEPADEPEPEPEPTPEPTEDAAPAGIAPGDISIQVLDGYKTDGGTAARGIASSLRDDGYRVVAENQALSYERTTVLWTEGNEAAARQVAAAIGAADVREQPGNLSSAVDVHVVVGADRA